jgi:hypothetical protein
MPALPRAIKAFKTVLMVAAVATTLRASAALSSTSSSIATGADFSEIHVSSIGGDDRTADGSASAPFASLAAARDAARRLRLLEPARTGRAVVVVHEGTHRLSETLQLGPQDAHTRWVAAAAEPPPRLSGGVVVGRSGWTRVASPGANAARTWRAALPAIFMEGGEQPPSSLWVGAQVRETKLAQKTSALYSCVPTGTHGPTCIFWANLIPFSLQRYQLARIPAPSTDARRVGEYNALQWHMPLDPTNDTALVNKHGVVVK